MKLSEQFNQRELMLVNFILDCIRQPEEKFKTSSVVDAFSWVRRSAVGGSPADYRNELTKERPIKLVSNKRRDFSILLPKFRFSVTELSNSCGTSHYHQFAEENSGSDFTEDNLVRINLLRMCLHFNASKSDASIARTGLLTFYHIQEAMLYKLRELSLEDLQKLYPNIENFHLISTVNSNSGNNYFGVLLSLTNKID